MAMLVYQSVILSVSLLKKAFQWDLHGAYLETYSISKMLLGNHTCKSHEVYSIYYVSISIITSNRTETLLSVKVITTSQHRVIPFPPPSLIPWNHTVIGDPFQENRHVSRSLSWFSRGTGCCHWIGGIQQHVISFNTKMFISPWTTCHVPKSLRVSENETHSGIFSSCSLLNWDAASRGWF